MKIIGKTSDGYIAAVSESEIKAMLSKDDSRRGKGLEVGTEVTFTTALANMELLQDIKFNNVSYTSVKEKLSQVKNEIDKAVEVLARADEDLIKVQGVIKDKKL